MVRCSYLDLAWGKIQSVDIITGLVLLLPVYKVQKLQMPLQQKIAVIGMFGLGALVTITGIIRLRFVLLAHPPLALSADFSRMFVPKKPRPLVRALNSLADSRDAAIQWSIIETNSGILSACLPTLRPLYNGYRIDLVLSKLSSFCRGSRSTTRLKDNTRLNKMEQDFSEQAGKVPHRRAGDPFAIYDELDFPIRSPEILPHRQDHQPWGSRQENHQCSISTQANQIK